MYSWKLSILVVGSTCECGLHFENQMNGAKNSESSRFDIMEMVENSRIGSFSNMIATFPNLLGQSNNFELE